MPSTTRHTIAAPLPAAQRRMPAAIAIVGADVALQRAADTTTWRWDSHAGGGAVVLRAETPATTQLEVRADQGTSPSVADALTVELYGALERTWAPAVPLGPPARMRLRAKLLIGATAILVPLVAMTGLRMLAPPKPVDVDAAVAQFRADSGPPAPATSADGEEAGQRGVRGSRGDRLQAGSDPEPVLARAERSDGRDRRRDVEPTRRPSTDQPDAGRQRGGAGASSAVGKDAAHGDDRAAAVSPDEGVYRYATEGYESIDQPSSRHDYPAETAMTLRHTDCGFAIRWQPLENRWDEMSICHQGRDSFIPSMSTHREFYGQSKDSKYTCAAGYYAWRPNPGATWIGRCDDQESEMQIRGRTLGTEAVRVGDQNIQAVHYVLEATISGGNEGTWRVERWVDPDTGLLVRMQGRTEATSDSSVGTVNYREETNLQLLSMTPQR